MTTAIRAAPARVAGAPGPRNDDDDAIIPAIGPDGAVFPIGKMEAHRRGVLHLAVSVFVISGDAVLLQRRASGKYHCAGLWANTCCSHPHWGEAPATAARRRLREEMGLCLELTQTGVVDYAADVSDGLRECERVHVFHAAVDRATITVMPDPAEVSETRWASLSSIRAELRDDPARFAPWFRIYLARWAELGFA